MKVLGAMLLCMLFLGCGANGIITDFSKQSTHVTKMKLANKADLELVTGGMSFTVPLKRVRSIRIRQEETMNFGGHHFVLTEILLADGTKYGTFNANSQTPKAWVRSDQFVEAQFNGGDFKILIGDISKLDITLE